MNEDLFASLDADLHRLAERQLQRSGGRGSPGTTTLVHEAFLQLSEREDAQFADRGRFLGYAARAMRGILIDYVRHSHAAKRGGGMPEITLTANLAEPAGKSSVEALERLSDALDALAELEPSLAELVDLHFFCGYELREIAELQGISERTVQRSWRKARLLLRQEMVDES